MDSNGRSPSLCELALDMGVEEDKVRTLYQIRAMQPHSLQTLISIDEDPTGLGDFIEDIDTVSTDEAAVTAVYLSSFRQALAMLA